MSYTTTDVIFKWSSKDNKGYYSSNYTMNINEPSKNIKYQYYYKNIDNEFLPIVAIDTPKPFIYQSTSEHSYITNIATIDIQYDKIIKYNNVDINNILTLQEIREYKLNKILNENTI